MKICPIIFFTLFVCSFATYSQVGINTTDPTTTLDINGSVRIRETGQVRDSRGEGVLATKVMGIDDEGNMVEIEVGDNVVLENNRLKAVNREIQIGEVNNTVIGGVLNNLKLLLLPGGVNEKRGVIRINNLLGLPTIITGLDEGYDGLHIFLYSNDTMIFSSLDILSWPQNRIMNNYGGTVVFQPYQMAELIYDGDIQRWILMKDK